MNAHHHYLFAIWMVGGIQTVFQNMKNALASKNGTTLSWLPIEMYPDDWITKIPPISLNGTWKNSMATWSRMRPLVKQHGPLDAAYFLDHSLLTFLHGFRRRVPYLLATDMTPLFCARHALWYAVPGYNPDSRVSQLKQKMTRSVYAGAYRLLPWSTAVRDSFVEDYHIPEERITVLPPGIDLGKWLPPDRTADLARVPGKPFKVLHVGWDFDRKGGDLLLELASEPEFEDCEFHFVTSSFAGQAAPNVFVHSDLGPNSTKLMSLYREADAFVLPTKADTFSIVALEAMAMALPVIISDVGGIRDIVEDGATGYLLRSGDRSRLRDSLRALRTDTALRIDMGLRGRKRVEHHFDLAQHVSTVMELLSAAAHSRTREDSR